MRSLKDYEDMLYLARPASAAHPPMPRENRAAQFSPFAALTGHAEAIRETQRQTLRRRELEEDSRELLDQKLQRLLARENAHPRVRVTCFRPDGRKEGGSYETVEGILCGIDEYERTLILEGRERILLERITEIEEKES